MSALAFGSSDLKVTFVPVKPRPGARPASRRVYARFGAVKSRLVQEICDTVSAGGDCVYIEARPQKGAPGPAAVMVPVHSWKRADWYSNRLPGVADFLKTAVDAGMEVVAFGADRAEWKLDFRIERHAPARDALDAEPDGADALVWPGGSPENTTGIREDF